MAKTDREKLRDVGRKLDAYREDDSQDRLTPVNVTVGDGGKVIINQGSNVQMDRSSPPPIPKDSIARLLADAFKQLPRGTKLAAYLGTLAFIAYLIASGTKLAGLW